MARKLDDITSEDSIIENNLLEDVAGPSSEWAEDCSGAEFLDESKHATIRKLMYNFKGPPVAPDEFRRINWIAMEADLENIIASGLIPDDTLASAGLDPESYEHFKDCGTNIQEKLWQGDLAKALSVLRGARRIFSASHNSDMKHVFRGPPVEVLANLYFDGIGVLPKERMVFADPYHYSNNPSNTCDE